MDKNEFINELNKKLVGRPDKNEIVAYYFELISDKVDNGENEEKVIRELGSIDEIVRTIKSNDDTEKREYVESVSYDSNKSSRVEETYVEDIKPKNNENKSTSAIKVTGDIITGFVKFWIIFGIVVFEIVAISVIVAGFICVGGAFFYISQSFEYTLMIAGAGLLTAGIGFILEWGCKLLWKLFVPKKAKEA